MYGRWYVGRLADLISTSEVAVEDFEHQNSKSKGIDRRQGMPFDNIPTALDDLGRSVTSGVGNEAAVGLGFSQ